MTQTVINLHFAVYSNINITQIFSDFEGVYIINKLTFIKIKYHNIFF